jgi:pimeloyl-ACP methyl ester carboxylesterase
MNTFSAYDGTELTYHVAGDGAPVICLPGGPMRDSGYLGDLGGLSAHRKLIMLDHRGTGGSAVPEDPASYRCDRLVDDVEALREHLGLERVDLLGHSAGANIAVLYAARYPHRLSRLALITPGTGAVGLVATGESRLEAALLRKDEPWYATAFAALERLAAGGGTAGDWEAVAPFFYGRWDATAQAHQAAGLEHQNEEAARIFGAEGAWNPDATRGAVANHPSPVLLFAGALDLNTSPRITAEYAALFPAAELVVQPGAGHYPWLDDADWFAGAVAAFLG